MKLKIASMLLGENVRVILDKIRAHQDEASDYLSRLKKLLQNKQNIDQQLSDLDKHKKDLERQIVTLRSEIEEKRPLQKVAEQIIKIEEDTRSKEKEVSASSSGNRELQQSVAHLQKDTVDLKSRKSLLEVEKRKYEENIGKDDTIPDELLSVNSEIVNLQNWLRIHSVELTQIENDITELIHALEEEEPIEVPQDDIMEEDEETGKESKDETPLVKQTEKEEPDNGKTNDTVEPSTRKKRDHKIKEIFDLETGETIYAEEFFKKPIDELQKWRTTFQQCILQNNRRFVCPKCLEMIRISGRGDERGVPAIFTHKNDSVSCKKTTTGQSVEDINRKKYGLFGQSQRHKDLKQELYDRLRDRNSLSLGISNVEMEKRVYSTLPFFSWRQPDVQIEYQGHKIVFEIQLSTTFLSVITERDTFYRLNDFFIIWIFNFDDNRKYVDLNNLAMKDIYFANKRNAFIFDDEARKWSRESGQLVLKCNWVEPDSTWHYANTEKRFGGEPVTLNMLKFDHNTHKLYYYDAETPYYEQNPDIAERLIVEQKTKEEYIKELEQKAQEKEIRKQEAIEQMMRDGGSVIPFEEKKRYGFKYGTTHIIEPHFTSCESRTDGTFIVGFNRKEGIVSQYGEMIRECEYIKIHRLTGSAYIAEDRDSFWLANVKKAFRERRTGDRVVSTSMTERVEKVSLFHKDEDEPFSSFYVLDGRKFFVHLSYSTIFIDLEGNKIVEEDFYKMKLILERNLMHVQRKKDGKWNDLDFDGNYISDWTIYEEVNEWGEELRIGKVHKEAGNWLQPERIYFDIIDTEGNIIIGGLSSIGGLNNGKAKVVFEGKNAEIDAKGHLVPEIQIQLSDNIKASKLLGYWELVNQEGKTILSRNDRILEVSQLIGDLVVIHQHFKFGLVNSSGIILPCNHRSVSLWTSNIIKVEDFNSEYLIDTSGKRISSDYRQISKLENGRAKVLLNNCYGYINENGQPIPEKEIQLSNGSVKYFFMGKWGVRNSKGQTTLVCSYDEITTYHGYYYVLVDRRITKTNWKTTNIVSVKGTKTRESDKTIVFDVGGKDFLVPREIASQYWNDGVPESADLIIKNFHKETSGKGWHRNTQLHVYAKPYRQQEKKSYKQREIAIHETVKGVINWVHYGSAIVRLPDRSTLYVHRSNFRGITLDKTYKGKEIELKKVGVNEEHNKDVWEIVRI
jgi:hypothetical protein